jgi:hypothetical protein
LFRGDVFTSLMFITDVLVSSSSSHRSSTSPAGAFRRGSPTFLPPPASPHHHLHQQQQQFQQHEGPHNSPRKQKKTSPPRQTDRFRRLVARQLPALVARLLDVIVDGLPAGTVGDLVAHYKVVVVIIVDVLIVKNI